ncbi:MAG: hypothetical protein ACAF41_21025 [Leptolyngbya sp. BL-A-14]
MEKLWRWLRQKVIHLHRLSDDWNTLQQRVGDFWSSSVKGLATCFAMLDYCRINFLTLISAGRVSAINNCFSDLL